MAFPDKALDPKNKLSKQFDEDKITTLEFQNILQELYLNNYCLVSIYDTISDDYTLTPNIPNFPENKKPLLLSFDNVTYKSNYQNHGEVDKIIIDRNNNLATYTTKKSIQDRIQYDNEFLVILENFIANNPDFSFNGARGIIFLSGEDGILGYNTNHKNASSKYEIERVANVVSVLKKKGWHFGSNNYKYVSDTNKSEIEFKKELTLWQKEIATIVGNTPLYGFPNGELDESKLTELNSSNFKILFHNSFVNELKTTENQIILARKNINGNTLRNNVAELSTLFDCKSVYDTINRHTPFY